MSKITFHPSIIEQLGIKTYTVPSAISELIANSLDANANNISIIINNDNDSIEIFDDGDGMTVEIIEKYFLKMASSKKSEKKFGSKGIGKLALFAIGKNAKITTKTKGLTSQNVFELNYSTIKELEDISKYDVEIRQVESSESKDASFTRLKITEKNPGSRVDLKQICKNLAKNFMGYEAIKDKNISITTIELGVVENISLKIDNSKPDSVIFYSLDEFNDQKIGELNFSLRKEQTAYKITKEEVKQHLTFEEVKKLIKDGGKFEIEKQIPALNSDGTQIEITPKISGYINVTNEIENNQIELIETINEDGEKFWKANGSSNSISVSVNDRVILENIIPYLEEKKKISERFYKSYISGNINADFLGKNYEGLELDDTINSNRQGFNTDNERFEYVADLASELVKMTFSKLSQNNKIRKDRKDTIVKEANSKIALELKNEGFIQSEKIDEVKKIISTINKGKMPKSRYVFVSHRSFDGEKINKFMVVIRKLVEGEGVDILFTSSSEASEKQGTGRLYKQIKNKFSDDSFTNTVMLCFVTKPKSGKSRGYTHNWNTDIEFGMGYQMLDSNSIFAFQVGELDTASYNLEPLSSTVWDIQQLENGFNKESKSPNEAGIVRHILDIMNVLKIERSEEEICDALLNIYGHRVVEQ